MPVLLLTGWQDLFLDQTIAQYQHLRRRGVDVAMTIGPWTHPEMVTRGAGQTAAETLAWLGEHLAGHPPHARPTPLRVFVTGTGGPGWVDLPVWPPPAREHLLYPQPYGGLDASPPAGGQGASFRFEPADPTPTLGGRLLSNASGYRDDTALSTRPDVLSFTGVPLDGGLLVAGAPVVELDYGCDNPHFDVFVRISEVTPDGRSRNVSDGYRRFAAVPDGLLRLELDPVAHRFAPGSRIRLLLAGSCHPRFARNLGTGEPVAGGRRMVGSLHTLRFGAGSRLILPLADID